MFLVPGLCEEQNAHCQGLIHWRSELQLPCFPAQCCGPRDWPVFPLLEVQGQIGRLFEPSRPLCWAQDTRNCPEHTARAVEPLGPTCHFILDADPAAFLFQVWRVPSILDAIMGSLAPIEGILDLDDLPRATVHGGTEAFAGQSLADTCAKVRWQLRGADDHR